MFKSKNGTWLEAQMDIFPKKIYRWPRDTWKICSLSLIKKYKLKLQWSITSHQSEYVSFKSLQIILINVEERVEKKEPSYTVGGNVTGAAPVENSVQVSLKIKNRASVGSYNPAPGDLSGENSEFKICRHPMFIAALLTIAKTWKQSDRQRCDVRTHTHTHTRWNVSHREWENAICSNMDGPGEDHIK